MNKAELIEALAARLGDRKTATAALDAVLTEVQQTVTKGDRVAITGFGVFEKRVRGARTARNPRTGEAVKVKKTSVPAFRAGAGFREMVASGRVPKVAAAKKTTAKATTAKATTAKATAKATAAKATTATKAAAAKKTATATKKAAPAKTAAKSTAAKTTTARKAAVAKKTSSAAAKKTTTARTTAAAKKAPARKAPAKKAR